MDQSKKTMRHFYCRDVLWDTFEQMAVAFDCSVDYLINEAMRFYAQSKNYQGQAPGGAPGFQGAQGPNAGLQGQQGQPMQGGQQLSPQQQQMAQQLQQLTPQQQQQLLQKRQQLMQQQQQQQLLQQQQQMAQQQQFAEQRRQMQQQQQPQQQMAPPSAPADMGYQRQVPLDQMQQAPGGMPQERSGGPPQPGQAAPRFEGGAAMAGAPQSTLFLLYNNTRYPVTKDQFIIGRGTKTSDLPIKDGNISRKHAAVIRRNGTYYIKDLGSTNGIDYKGMRIDNKRIDEGDVFMLCDYELRFTYRP